MDYEQRSLLKKFSELNIDVSMIGLEQYIKDEPYFCSPVGTEVIGWLGVDGIHFCTIPSLQTDMVFAVSPMPCGEHHVEPIANNFKDFLQLVLACRDASPLEQISWMSEKQFIELLVSDAETFIGGKDDVLQAIKNNFNIEACSNPYWYVKALQKDFDYSSIPFSDEYFEVKGKQRL